MYCHDRNGQVFLSRKVEICERREQQERARKVKFAVMIFITILRDMTLSSHATYQQVTPVYEFCEAQNR
jgi:hypothetical protein